MTSSDSRPAPTNCADPAPHGLPEQALSAPEGAARRLSEMRRDFAPAVYAAILAALQSDLAAVAAGLAQSSGPDLARQGHVLTALAGELGEESLSARGRQIELGPDPGFAAETAAMIAPLLQLLAREAAG